MSNIGQFLGEDHRHCDEYFLVAERAVAAHDWDTARQSLHDFRHAIERHLAMEEQVLFIAYEAFAGAAGPSQVMRREHEQMRGLFSDLTRALERRVGAEFLSLSETLLVLMRQHNMKEEQILYPLCDRLLVPERDDLIARMRRIQVQSTLDPV